MPVVERPSAPFYRERDRDRILELVAGGARLVSLVGAGGIGKTTLAREIAREHRTRHGAAWIEVPLDEVEDRVDDVLGAIIDRLDDGSIGDGDVAPIDVLVERLSSGAWHLLLDTFERAPSAAPAIEELVARCPGVVVLVTSRRRLGIPDEHAVRMSGLPVSRAVELFRLSAADVLPGSVTWTKADQRQIAEIATRLDGNPLAIEIAAGALSITSLPELRSSLAGHDLAGLVGLPRASGGRRPERHDSLEATVRWTLDTLPTATRRVALQLSAFLGWSSLDAVAAVCGVADDDRSGRARFLTAVRDLAETHVIETDTEWSGGTRVRMPDPVRETALLVLEGAGGGRSELDRDDLARRHAAWYLAEARRGAGARQGEGAQDWVERADSEFGNHLLAVRWFARHDPASALTMLIALGPLWLTRSRSWTAMRRLREIVAQVDAIAVPDADRIRATAWIARLELDHGPRNLRAVIEDCARRLADLPEDAGPEARLEVGEHLVHARLAAGAYAEAREAARECAAVATELDSDHWAAVFRFLEVRALQQEGDRAAALEALREAAAAARRASSLRLVTRIEQVRVELQEDLLTPRERADDLARVHRMQLEAGDLRAATLGACAWGVAEEEAGSFARAARCYEIALDLAETRGFWNAQLYALMGLVSLGIATGVHTDAARLHASIEPHLERAVTLLPESYVTAFRASAARLELDERARREVEAAAPLAWPEVLASARRLREAITARLSTGRSIDAAAAEFVERHRLSDREVEVLSLLVRGLTNREIGERLFLSPKTVTNHNLRIFRKIGVRTRAEAVAVAMRGGLTAPEPLED